jgi:phosphate/sulfate permease
MKPDAQRETFREAGLPVIALIGLFSVCALLGFVMLALFGPVAGIIGAIAGLGIYAWLGPRPMPGFLPGILALWMLAASLGAIIASVIQLFR